MSTAAWTPMTEHSVLATVTLADEQAPPEAEDVVAGWAGFIVLAALVIATGFLIRSMSKRLRRIDFDEGPDPDQPDSDDDPRRS